MNGLIGDLDQADALAAAMARRPPPCRVALCPPASLIAAMAARLAGKGVLVGGQDCHPDPAGARTGDISAEMLRDAGAALVIVGHSERRAGHHEDDALVARKSAAALRAGLEPIICVGESHDQRRAGDALAVVVAQVRGSVAAELEGHGFFIAYEPVWAIGSGLIPLPEEIEAVHAAIRRTLVEMFGETGRGAPILYGGSVKPDNAARILGLAEVGGALVGGASLKADEFASILHAV
jgi:triosephosphate isomerase